MGIFNWFRKKQELNHILTEEDRIKGLELRRMNQKINQLEKQLEMKQHLAGLQEMIEGFGEEKGDGMEKIFLPLLMSAFQNKNQNVETSDLYGSRPQAAVINPQKNQFIAEQLKKRIPKEYLAELRELSDGDIIDIKQRIIM